MTLATIVGLGLALVAPEPDAPEPDAAAVTDVPDEGDPRERARAFAQEGEAAFTTGRYDEASEAYQQAHQLDRVPLYLFAWARSEQEAGRCDEAIAIYQRFIATLPPAEDVDRANLEIGRCYGEITSPEPEPEPEPRVTPSPELEPEPEPDPSDPRSPRAPWLRDPWGGILVATGVVGLSVGTGLYLQALADQRRASAASTTDEFRAASRRATNLSGAGIAGFTIGSALLVGAVVRYVVVARRDRRSTRAHSPWPLQVRF